MGALESNTTLIYGVHIRESASDGSDFSNGATDYRVLFLGEDGQLHVKDSAGAVTDIGGGSSGIPATIVDAKGDIIAATAADTVARLAVGTNGYALHADSAQSSGLLWANVLPPIIVPLYGAAHAASATIGAANRSVAVPVYVPTACTITGVRLKIANATGNGDVGIYTTAGSRVANHGGAAWVGTGIQTISFTASGSYAAAAGWYYLAMSASSNTASFSVCNVGGTSGPLNAYFMETNYPLGTTFTSAGDTSFNPAIVGLVSGGYA